MDIKPRRGHFFRNLPLKWSFVAYVTSCIVGALLLCLLLVGLFQRLQNNIFREYEALYRDSLARSGSIVSDGVIVQKDAIWYYTESLSGKFTPRDARLYDLYGALSVLIAPIVFIVCIVITGVTFFRRKIKRPLAVLNAASVRIAAGDLNFQVVYDSRNEFGRLADSFEVMRGSLERTNREMWEMMEERKRLNAAFAHDLRTPLTVLRGYGDFLLNYQEKLSREKTVSTLALMSAYVKRLEGYTETMSSLQRLSEVEPAAEEVSFELLCEGLEAAAQALAGGKRLTLERQGGGMLCLDSALVHEACCNLFSNAARYAHSALAVRCRATEHAFIITVKDDGPGFTQEALARATEPYYRDKPDKDALNTEHFGIGLYVCRLLCEAHGGALKLENDSGGKVSASFQLQICR